MYSNLNYSKNSETVAALPGGFGTVHAIRLGIEPFAELGANSESLRGSRVDSPCSCRAILKSAPVTLLQSQILPRIDRAEGLRKTLEYFRTVL